MWTPLPMLAILALAAGPLQLRAQESACCSLATGSCRSVCQEVSLVQIAADAEERERAVSRVSAVCPDQLVPFWECMNKTTEDMERGESWWGRACCGLPQSPLCQQACVTAAGRHALSAAACRRSDELAFFACLDRQQAGAECCGDAAPAACQSACRDVFRETGPAGGVKAVERACAVASPRALACARNHTAAAPVLQPHKYVPCCEAAEDLGCREACRRLLRTRAPAEDIVDGLQEAGCGPPLPHDRLWQCFLQHQQEPAAAEAASGAAPGAGAGAAGAEASEAAWSRIDRAGMDAAKLHCCARAAAPACRRLCFRTYSSEWVRFWPQFSASCLEDPAEEALLSCVQEVEEPCELGCGGLSFCAAVSRPLQLFRSCDARADAAARAAVSLWSRQGAAPLPLALPLPLPLLDVRACRPHLWRAVACALHLAPCHHTTRSLTICREDCESLLQSCVDWRRAARGLSAGSVCAQLSAGGGPCAPLSALLAPAGAEARAAPQDAISAPCRGRPCNHSRACLPNRDCAAGRPCHTHRCLPGCRLGEVSQLAVPGESLVVVPQSAGCPRLCRCPRHGGALHRCEPLPCAPPQPCWIGNTRIEHNSQFYMECNLCACSSGELTCTRRQCDSSAAAYSGQPCNCPAVYAPVCAASGVTYASACLARCAGAGDGELEAGACPERDPCSRHGCARGQHCVPLTATCLDGVPRHSCRQHLCVEKVDSCSSRPHDPVCDTEGEEHPNLCFLLHYWKALAYRGPCLKSCTPGGAVCGADGVTYRSECEALAARVPVDYAGRCSACRDLSRCPPLPAQGCQPLRPPGACCPVCAGVFILLYSRKQVELSAQVVRGDWQALTVRAVVSALERLVAVAECVVQGYAGVGPQLVVVVAARTPGHAPSRLQLDACAAEARKLAALVRARSPRLAAQLPLSLLVAAEDVTAAQARAGAGAGARAPDVVAAWLLALTLAFHLSASCT